MNDKNKEGDSIGAIWDALEMAVLRMPEKQLLELAAELGIDAERSAAEGERLVHELSRAHRYQSMLRKAEEKKLRDQEARASVSPGALREGIARIMGRIAAGEPGLQAAFRDRSPEQMTEAELKSIAEDLYWAERLKEGEGDGEG